jgi:hypothetical protein
MQDDLKSSDWNYLLKRIQRGECTPILGADANFMVCPSVADIARQLAKDYGYPLDDLHDLARVAQFITSIAPSNPKELLHDLLSDLQVLNASDPEAPYNVLAAMPFPLYITTNHDDQLEQSLIQRGKQPQRMLWVWNHTLTANRAWILKAGFTLEVDACSDRQPVVFHLFGHYAVPESLVLTEDDYLDFLVSVASSEYKLPPRILEAYSHTPLIFIGFHHKDWSFRVLLRAMAATVTAHRPRLNITVQLPLLTETTPEPSRLKAQEFLNAYFQNKSVRGVYWGTAYQFAADLHHRWQEGNYEVLVPATLPVAERMDDTQIREQLAKHFNLEELRLLCADLRIEYENLGASTLEGKAQDLIAYCRRHGNLENLLILCRTRRPYVPW